MSCKYELFDNDVLKEIVLNVKEFNIKMVNVTLDITDAAIKSVNLKHGLG